MNLIEKKILKFSPLLLLLIWGVVKLPSCGNPSVKANEAHAVSTINNRVEGLLRQMTLEEKVGQMTQLTLDVVLEKGADPPRLDMDVLRKAIVEYHTGSILNTAADKPLTREQWKEVISAIQEMATKNTRLQIPVIYGIDAIHGTNYTVGATLFPQQIGLGSTFNVELVEKLGSLSAYETKASGIAWNFSPVLDLGIDPRWPRLWETFGEDPYLTSELGVALVRGYQGNDVSHPEKVAACAKHFVGYSFPVSGKDRTPAWIPDRQLREYFVPSFKAAINSGIKTVMINSGEINGIPVHVNHELLTKLLKEELGFEGFMVTDWQDIEYLHDRHKVAQTQKEAVKLAINAGIDMSMVPDNLKFADYLIELVREGEVPVARIDDAVRRILRVKFELGLFEQPVPDFDAYPDFGSDKHERLSYQSAVESLVLLRNEKNILPLQKGKKILVTGPNANSMRTLNGGWSYSWQGKIVDDYTSGYKTILQALTDVAGKGNVRYVEGVAYNWKGEYYDDRIIDLQAVARAASGVDYIVLCLGENTYTEKPGDLEDLYLSPNQVKLAQTVIATGKPVVLLLNQGRPRVISQVVDKVDAVLNVWLPGNQGGPAIADVLFGNANPSGKLSVTYPRFPNSLVTYIHKHTEALENIDSVTGTHFSPQYEFGHGLSYTTFAYSNLTVNKSTLSPDEDLTVTVEVKNTGNRAGKEAVLLFVSDLYASITPEVKRLRRFAKTDLQPGESATLTFTLNGKDLAFIGKDLNPVTEEGDFEIMVGNLKQRFRISQTKTFDGQQSLPVL